MSTSNPTTETLTASELTPSSREYKNLGRIENIANGKMMWHVRSEVPMVTVQGAKVVDKRVETRDLNLSMDPESQLDVARQGMDAAKERSQAIYNLVGQLDSGLEISMSGKSFNSNVDSQPSKSQESIHNQAVMDIVDGLNRVPNPQFAQLKDSVNIEGPADGDHTETTEKYRKETAIPIFRTEEDGSKKVLSVSDRVIERKTVKVENGKRKASAPDAHREITIRWVPAKQD